MARASVSTNGPSATRQAALQLRVEPVASRVPSVEAVATEPATSVTPPSAGEKSWPGGPIGPWSPTVPRSPLAPAGPVAPIAPTAPAGPVGPIAPIAPGTPWSPAGPWGPTGP